MNNENRLVCIKSDQVMTTSKAMADSFGRDHNEVLKSIRGLVKSKHLGLGEYTQSSYLNKQNKSQPINLGIFQQKRE